MRGIKIPLQDFVLKMQGGGAYARGGVFTGHYGICVPSVLQYGSYTHQCFYNDLLIL